MSRFLYFLPGETRAVIERTDVEALGIGYAFDSSIQCVDLPKGPSDSAGLLVAPGDGRLAYEPDEQTWMKVAGSTRTVWVGFDRRDRPTPEKLVRSKVYPGQPVTLRDGNAWLVPQALISLNRSTLPKVYSIDGDGQLTRKAAEPYAKLCEGAEHVLGVFLSIEMPMSTEESLRLSTDAIGVNYRIGYTEAVGLLGLFGDEELWAVGRALIDADGIEAATKKKAQDTSAS